MGHPFNHLRCEGIPHLKHCTTFGIKYVYIFMPTISQNYPPPQKKKYFFYLNQLHVLVHIPEIFPLRRIVFNIELFKTQKFPLVNPTIL